MWKQHTSMDGQHSTQHNNIDTIGLGEGDSVPPFLFQEMKDEDYEKEEK